MELYRSPGELSVDSKTVYVLKEMEKQVLEKFGGNLNSMCSSELFWRVNYCMSYVQSNAWHEEYVLHHKGYSESY